MNKQLTDNKASLQQASEFSKKQFSDKIARYNAIACDNKSNGGFNVEQAFHESKNHLEALNVQGGIQEMLAAQMTSLHFLQQTSAAMANRVTEIKTKQFFTNSAIKLSNSFVQLANILTKLQGSIGQKIIVEHVEVHHGGQAVVGNINGGTPN